MKEVLDDQLIDAPLKLIVIESNKAVFTFKKSTAEEITKQIDEVFKRKQYKLEEGSTTRGKYGKGSLALRILFGAFAKRFCWETRVEPDGTDTRFTLIKDAKGYAGGLIGMNQVSNEYKRMTDAFTLLHTTLHN
jgi:hypothetical protein